MTPGSPVREGSGQDDVNDNKSGTGDWMIRLAEVGGWEMLA